MLENKRVTSFRSRTCRSKPKNTQKKLAKKPNLMENLLAKENVNNLVTYKPFEFQIAKGDLARTYYRKRRFQLCLNINFQKLPEELIFEIFSLLTGKDLLNIGKTCKLFYRIATDTSLWKNLCMRKFKTTILRENVLGNSTWFQQYMLSKTPSPKKENTRNCYRRTKRKNNNKLQRVLTYEQNVE